MKLILLICCILLFGCGEKYAYYYPSCVVIDWHEDSIPKVGDILPNYWNGEVIEVNIHGKRKGATTNYGIPYAEQKISEGSENYTYIYYDYVVKVPKRNQKEQK